MIIFLRLRKSPQTPKKKSVKETPKYLKASIGIVYFYAMWLCYPRGNLLYRWSSLLLWVIYIVDYLAQHDHPGDTKAKRGIEPLTYKYESYALPIKLFCLNIIGKQAIY